MSLGVDPIVSNLIYSMTLILQGAAPKEHKLNFQLPKNDLPLVSVLMTFYKEKKEDIDLTVGSLIEQTYPNDRYELLMAIEPDDPDTKRYVEECLHRLKTVGITARMVVSDGKLKIKPHALNLALKTAKGEICAFYDASDDIDRDQIEKAVAVIIKGKYDVAQAKVLRKGNSLLSRFLFLDTVLWFWKYIPFLLKYAKGMPLSGEGLFIRRDVLHESGYFPEVLTEDAYLGLLLTEKNKRFALVDSIVVEKAPKNIRAHFTQKLRWHRGYLTCLKKLFKLNISMSRKLAMLLIFISPITCGIALFGWLLVLLYWISEWAAHTYVPYASFISPWTNWTMFNDVMHYWSLFLFFFGIPLAMFSCLHTLLFARMKKEYWILPFLLPIHWIFVGLCAVAAPFQKSTYWGKTVR